MAETPWILGFVSREEFRQWLMRHGDTVFRRRSALNCPLAACMQDRTGMRVVVGTAGYGEGDSYFGVTPAWAQAFIERFDAVEQDDFCTTTGAFALRLLEGLA